MCVVVGLTYLRLPKLPLDGLLPLDEPELLLRDGELIWLLRDGELIWLLRDGMLGWLPPPRLLPKEPRLLPNDVDGRLVDCDGRCNGVNVGRGVLPLVPLIPRLLPLVPLPPRLLPNELRGVSAVAGWRTVVRVLLSRLPNEPLGRFCNGCWRWLMRLPNEELLCCCSGRRVPKLWRLPRP